MSIYVKTPKGMNELLARKSSIHPGLNSVLVLVDGRRNGEEILRLALASSAPADCLQALEFGGFIARQESGAEREAQAATNAADDAAQNASRFQQAYRYFIDTAQSRLGFRGMGLQLKLARTHSLAELRTLTAPMSDAIAKQHGLQAANDFVREAERVLSAQDTRRAGLRMVAQAGALDAERAAAPAPALRRAQA